MNTRQAPTTLGLLCVEPRVQREMARWGDKENPTYYRPIGGLYGVSLGQGCTHTWLASTTLSCIAYGDLPSQTEV